jgi:hypothetical protein
LDRNSIAAAALVDAKKRRGNGGCTKLFSHFQLSVRQREHTFIMVVKRSTVVIATVASVVLALGAAGAAYLKYYTTQVRLLDALLLSS